MEQEQLKGLLALAFLGVVGLFIIFRGFQLRKRAQRIADLARSKSASAPQGLVELEGFAWCLPDQELANLQGRPCVYHAMTLQREEVRGSGKNRRREWVTVFSKSAPTEFLLLDPAGAVKVSTSGMESHLQEGVTRNWNRLSSQERQRAIEVIPLGVVSGFPPGEGFLGQLFGSKFRVIYEYIPVGSPLHVTGHLESSRGISEDQLQDPALIDFAVKVIDFKAKAIKSRDRYLDLDRNGKVSEIEARRGYQNAAELSLKKAKSGLCGNLVAPPELKIHGSIKRSAEHALTVIDAFEEFAIRRLARKSWGAIALGFAITVVSLFAGLHVQKKMVGSAHQATQGVHRAR